MKKIPLWKIRRELLRFFRQFINTPNFIVNYYFSTFWYDNFLAKKKQTTPGDVPIGRKIAIYLIYPQFGLQQSHIAALDYLLAKDYSTVVVSNLALSEKDKSAVICRSALIIERPNFGYDFGGYRDGILQLREHIHRAERLVLLNDSAWFPVPGSRDWLDDGEALDVEFFAAVSNYGAPRPDHNRFEEMEWSYSHLRRNFHYCSFALAISGRILKSRRFYNFWRKFPLSNKKSRTVRRGEIGLTQWVISNGFTHASTFEPENLDKELAALSHHRLAELVGNLIIPEDTKLLAVKQRIVSDVENQSHSNLGKFVLTVVARQGSSYSLADYTIREKGFAFLKKSPVWLSEDAWKMTLKIVGRFSSEFRDVVESEILELRKRKVRKTFNTEAESL